MKVLLVHNFYQQSGGEDAVFLVEVELLCNRGHEVIEFVEDNCRLNGVNPLRAAVEVVWSRESYRRLKQIIRGARLDVAHFHNTFPRVSPSAQYMSVHTVQTLQDHRGYDGE